MIICLPNLVGITAAISSTHPSQQLHMEQIGTAQPTSMDSPYEDSAKALKSNKAMTASQRMYRQHPILRIGRHIMKESSHDTTKQSKDTIDRFQQMQEITTAA
jgi:hypothetical protein